MTKKVIPVDEATIRFAGDSGDGMQLTGTRFTETTAIVGNDLKTIPNYPSEIRAPAGTLDKNLKMAGWESNPLEDGSLESYTVFKIEMSKIVGEALKDSDLTAKGIERTKNMFALGVLFWMFNRPLEPTAEWLGKKFAKNRNQYLPPNINL